MNKRLGTYRMVLVVTALGFLTNAFPVFARHTTTPSDACTCSVRLSYAKPDVQVRSGIVTVTPRINLDIRTRGKTTAPAWALQSTHEGTITFDSDDLPVPSSISFGKTQTLAGGQCGNNHYTASGVRLDTITLDQVSVASIHDDQEIQGRVALNTQLAGCAQEEEHRAFEFIVKEFGNLKIKSWRSI